MQVIILYSAVVLIWGSTWIAISYQLGTVPEELSIAYRFSLASLALFVYALLTRRKIGIPLKLYPMVIVQGVFLFSLNYFFVYRAANYITTGLIAVVFSLIVLFNAYFERLFFKTPVDSRFLLASALGLLGISLVFWPEVSAFNLKDRTVAGVLLIIVSVASASLGNMAAIFNMRQKLPVVALNAHAMGCGALLSAAYAIFIGREISFSTDPEYLWSLLYLAIFGSAVAFGCMLSLLRQIGAARAAYTSVLFPIVALIISTVVEDYQWSTPAFAGIALALLGNWLALSKNRKQQTSKTI